LVVNLFLGGVLGATVRIVLDSWGGLGYIKGELGVSFLAYGTQKL
jgi:hypothetical protein